MPAGGAVHTRGAARWISGKETGSGVLAGLVGFLRAPVARRLCLAPLAPISLWVPTSETWLPRRLCRAPGQSGARTGTVSRTVPDLAAPTAGRQLGGLYVRVAARAGVLSCVLASVHASVRACVLASVCACWCPSVMLTSAHACWRPCAPAYVRGGVRPCVLASVRACWRPRAPAYVRGGVRLCVPASAHACWRPSVRAGVRTHPCPCVLASICARLRLRALACPGLCRVHRLTGSSFRGGVGRRPAEARTVGRAPGLSPHSDAGDRDGQARVPRCVPSPRPHPWSEAAGLLGFSAFMKKYHVVAFVHVYVLLEVSLNSVKSL